MISMRGKSSRRFIIDILELYPNEFQALECYEATKASVENQVDTSIMRTNLPNSSERPVLNLKPSSVSCILIFPQFLVIAKCKEMYPMSRQSCILIFPQVLVIFYTTSNHLASDISERQVFKTIWQVIKTIWQLIPVGWGQTFCNRAWYGSLLDQVSWGQRFRNVQNIVNFGWGQAFCNSLKDFKTIWQVI